MTITSKIVTVEVDSDGSSRTTINIPLTKIVIENIMDVLVHSIARSDRAVSHHIVFLNGGEGRISYRLTDGKVLELSIQEAGMGVSPEGVLTFHQKIEK